MQPLTIPRPPATTSEVIRRRNMENFLCSVEIDESLRLVAEDNFPHCYHALGKWLGQTRARQQKGPRAGARGPTKLLTFLPACSYPACFFATFSAVLIWPRSEERR